MLDELPIAPSEIAAHHAEDDEPMATGSFGRCNVRLETAVPCVDDPVAEGEAQSVTLVAARVEELFNVLASFNEKLDSLQPTLERQNG